MANECTDEQYLAAMALIKQRDSLLSEVASISAEIDKLIKLRAGKISESRRLKSSAIAFQTGLPKTTVECISECRSVRASNLDEYFKI